MYNLQCIMYNEGVGVADELKKIIVNCEKVVFLCLTLLLIKALVLQLELLIYISIFIMKRKNTFCQNNFYEVEQV